MMMKTDAFIRRIDSSGSVILPVDYRRSLQIEEGDQFECSDKLIEQMGKTKAISDDLQKQLNDDQRRLWQRAFFTRCQFCN